MTELSAPPVLSTPESHIFEDPTPITIPQPSARLNDDEIYDVYEVARTAREIREGGWRRIALQFPDKMLCDAPKVSAALEKELEKYPTEASAGESKTEKLDVESLEKSFNAPDRDKTAALQDRARLYILADTSYGACCVDEVAAEHVNAEVVVHYGRSCLSPTARLPVIYVFTSPPFSIPSVVEAFQNTYSEKDALVILMADIPFHSRIATIAEKLKEVGYKNVLVPGVVHDPGSRIPNREVDEKVDLKTYSLFHISDPPRSLLLTLASQVLDMYIYPTETPSSQTTTPTALKANTAITLRRRYAIITSLSTYPVYGILVNTLSVKNYLPTIDKLRAQIAAAGKKSYTFVVGKVNAAKVANFSEIGGWVVVGCWESGLVEGADFFRPVITPFELTMVLMKDEERIWTGEWRGGFEGLKIDDDGERKGNGEGDVNGNNEKGEKQQAQNGHIDVQEENGDEDTEEESEPPEFDFRTGRYVSHSRPMRKTFTVTEEQKPIGELEDGQSSASKVLTRRARMDLATVNGEVSPGAEYLKSQRTWQGLGSDFHEVSEEERVQGGLVEQGRSGVARGYTVGDIDDERR
ncbi:putative diphthamide synthesis protein-domain-containing protein [Xylogone sp. PMI_703]|nr:putative diphthamide synthesis protein-domain-containing protein [Xylogone sp. PMI_703]